MFSFGFINLELHFNFSVHLISAVTIANVLACKGLDRIEKTLPILHQPSEQVRARWEAAVA